MKFEYSDEQQMLRDSVSKFVQNDYDFENRKRAMGQPKGYSEENWALFAELGWLMMLFGENDGGLGGSAVDLIALMEELGKGIVIEPMLATVILGGGVIAEAGNDDQKQTLETLMQGQTQLAFAYAEPESRYNLASVKTTAQIDGEKVTISGRKSVVLNGQHADFIVVSARTSGSTLDTGGISLFLVPANSPGLETKPYSTVDGFQAAEVIFNAVEIDANQQLGATGEALPVIEKVISRATLAVCAEAVGAMEIAFKKTVEYSKTRKQFGTAIGQFQALQHRMADMFIEYEQAKSMLLMAAIKSDANNGIDESAISAAKSRIGKAARKIGQESVQIHGGIGVTDELDVAHYFKRLTTIQFMFGSTDFHTQRFSRLG